jgi:hypothetical protein
MAPVRGCGDRVSEVGDVEFAIARAAVHANYICRSYSFLAPAFVIFISTAGPRRLVPRDLTVLDRLGLGLMIGGCIWPALSSYAPHQVRACNPAIASLTLSASRLAFLAGFGVEGVFSMLQTLVRRIFPAGQDNRPRWRRRDQRCGPDPRTAPAAVLSDEARGLPGLGVVSGAALQPHSACGDKSRGSAHVVLRPRTNAAPSAAGGQAGSVRR